MNKALIKKLDAMPGGATMSVVVKREGRTLVLIKNGMLLKRAPQPIGLAFEVVARCSHKVSVFIMPHFKATLEPGEGRNGPLLRVCDEPDKRYTVADDSGVTRRYVQFPYLDSVRSNILALSETVTEDTLTGSGDECEAFVSLLKGNNTHTSLKVVEVPHA